MKTEIRRSITGCIFQIAVWILFILSIIYKLEITFIFFGITYFFYIIIEFCSSTSAYLYNKNSQGEIYQKMDKLFNTIQKFEFICKDAKNCQFILTQLFKYRFSKDISSPFELNLHNINIVKNNYIKLRLNKEIIFADSGTAHEYAIQKSAFIRNIKRQYKDSKFIIEERKYIPELIIYNSISIKNINLWRVL